MQYLQDLNCPFGVQERQEAVDWLLGLAVRYEYGDNGKNMVKHICCTKVCFCATQQNIEKIYYRQQKQKNVTTWKQISNWVLTQLLI